MAEDSLESLVISECKWLGLFFVSYWREVRWRRGVSGLIIKASFIKNILSHRKEEGDSKDCWEFCEIGESGNVRKKSSEDFLRVESMCKVGEEG